MFDSFANCALELHSGRPTVEVSVVEYIVDGEGFSVDIVVFFCGSIGGIVIGGIVIGGIVIGGILMFGILPKRLLRCRFRLYIIENCHSNFLSVQDCL